MIELSELELELMAEHIANSCRDVAEKVETGNDGKERLTIQECALCDQISCKLIGIFLENWGVGETMN